MDKNFIPEDDGATAFDLPNNMRPMFYNDIRYGNQYVPKPTNSAAKVVEHKKCMNQVMQGK